MPDQERDENLTELSDWVETVLRPSTPDYTAGQIRSCWPNHPEARWELAWLYHLWYPRLSGATSQRRGTLRTGMIAGHPA